MEIGLVSGARLAELGNDIACMNIDSRKINIFNHADALNIVTEWYPDPRRVDTP